MESKKTSFLDLPAEIRNEIYTLALHQSKPIILPAGPPGRPVSADGLYFRVEPPLLVADHEIRAEATAVFYGGNMFHAPWSSARPSAASAFLKQLGPERSAMLRRLKPFGTSLLKSDLDDRRKWLDTVFMATNRLTKGCKQGLHKDTLLIPVMEEDSLIWKRLSEIQEFEVVGSDYEWSIHW